VKAPPAGLDAADSVVDITDPGAAETKAAESMDDYEDDFEVDSDQGSF